MAASPLRIDFVSDVACPWCAVGLWSLDRAIERLGDEVPVELHFEPFELNPTMPPEGEDAVAYIARKYGRPPEQIAQTRAMLRERGAEVGFAFGDRQRIWNTFDAHRLLHWAGLAPGGGQAALKHAFLSAYHGRGENPGDRAVLLRAVEEVGLDAARAAAILDSDEYGAEVGFAFGDRQRIWNTFDAHRLLHWAGLTPGGGQAALKHALLAAYHGRGENPGDRAVLLRAVDEAGLDGARAAAILDSDEYASEVRARERHWQQLGIHGVPAAIISGRHLISGGQPPEVFEQALRQIAAGTAA